MSLNVEMLLEEPLPEDCQEMLDILKTEIDRLERSTNHYLDLSQTTGTQYSVFRPNGDTEPLDSI